MGQRGSVKGGTVHREGLIRTMARSGAGRFFTTAFDPERNRAPARLTTRRSEPPDGGPMAGFARATRPRGCTGGGRAARARSPCGSVAVVKSAKRVDAGGQPVHDLRKPQMRQPGLGRLCPRCGAATIGKSLKIYVDPLLSDGTCGSPLLVGFRD